MKILILFLLSWALTGAMWAQSLDSAIAAAPPFLHHIRDSHERMTFRLTGVYIEHEVLYYRLVVANHSHIGFTLDQLRFSIRDVKKVRRHAYQEVYLTPLSITGDTRTVGADEEKVWVVALPKWVLPPFQYLSINLLERQGGRHLSLKVGYRTILHAHFVNDLQLSGNHTDG